MSDERDGKDAGSLADSTAPSAPAYIDPTAPLPGETYIDGPYLVFNEAYHLRRGYCCNSDCRHCPYR